MSSFAPFAPLCSAPVALTHKIGLPSLRSAYRYLLILILLRFCILEPKILICILEPILIHILEFKVHSNIQSVSDNYNSFEAWEFLSIEFIVKFCVM